MSGITQLVAAHLRPIQEESVVLASEFTLALHAQATTIAAEAVAGCGLGLDHFNGEHVLAAMLQRETPRGYEHRLTCAITDRRTVVSGWSSIKGGYNDTRFTIPHAEIARVVVKDSLLANYVKLYSVRGSEHMLTFASATKLLGPLYEALGSLHPQARVAPSLPLPLPSPDDPAACAATNHSLWRPDPAITAALGHIDRLVREGGIAPASGYDFACRLLLLHRSAISGPGSNGVSWLSPMSGGDLARTVGSMFGPPVQHQDTPDGWSWYHFRVDPQRDELSPVLTGLGVAAYVGLGVGFSPGGLIAHQMMKREPLTGFRLGAMDTSACCMYSLDGPRGRLEQCEAMFAHQLHQAMIHSAYRVLERRCICGWETDYSGLF